MKQFTKISFCTKQFGGRKCCISFKNIVRDVHEIKPRETGSSVTSKLIGAVTKIRTTKCCDKCNKTGANKHCLCKENAYL